MYCTQTEVPNLTLSSWTSARVTLLSHMREREEEKPTRFRPTLYPEMVTKGTERG